jgi:hypothetical protein
MSGREYDELLTWLEADETSSRPYRTSRLKLLLEIFDSPKEHLLLSGGEDSATAYRELRLAFVHGLYLATVILTLSVIEQELGGALYARGLDKSARATLETLLDSAMALKEIDSGMFDGIHELRRIRNAYAHFRTPLHETGTVRRALQRDTGIHGLSEFEAVNALRLLAAFLAR